ncbi:MAG: 1-(5-phosphoribosyl)-5-[(5-phosphoribosylamino)methylideneamino]imidazole-4-carboxamide isomerase [Clostridium sp.]
MIIIPAIDIIDGKPVRLYQGDYDKKEIVGEDILEIALEFQRKGAEYVHLVDLDGAKEGKLINGDIIVNVAKTLDIPVEVGGGIRTIEDIDYLIENGVSRVILGSVAIDDELLLIKAVKKYKDKIAVGIDCKDGKVCTHGWLSSNNVRYLDFAKKMQKIGVDNIIFTDIARDGTLSGPNLAMLNLLVRELDVKITASGGVRDIDCIKALNDLRIYGAITGKAIYSGTISLDEAIEVTKKR